MDAPLLDIPRHSAHGCTVYRK